ncbi:peptidase C14 [Scytonema hofmannii PCC 7110]|uniref:Peptidase C14 n=1 Tax=Scytonema hofmannii PCC 7110 TaxID=128403 RepID=A0A139X078_9CYAN|nr:caspase family protein [Scytonema hofmannii]KYC38032.1 peptidase C14 [Scytonema hofmannii PCC 7110]
MKRRTFLQRIGSILAIVGVTDNEWLTLGNRYSQALAQPRPHKLALLVGINQYPQFSSLTGCLTDVELQKELLIHRFGFQPSDILCLTDAKATREDIELAFSEHLVKQVQPDDAVVFHFSGYGSRIQLETSQDTLQNALVTVTEKEYTQDNKNVNYLLEDTLLLLVRSLPTHRATAVLDTSYYVPQTSLPTGLRTRARPVSVDTVVVEEEVQLQKQLKEKVSAPSPGVVLTATSHSKQLAREIQLSGFSAGLFTYALTQYLWETTPATTVQVCISHVAGTLQQLGSTKQQPAILADKTDKNNPQARAFVANHFLPDSNLGASGVVMGIEEDGKTLQLWLGGLPLNVLEYLGANSRLTLVPSIPNSQLVLRSRTGLMAKAQIVNIESEPKVGQLIQEAVRVLPKNVGLTVALDTKLERIERVDATSAFSTVSRLSTVVAGEQLADYVFGKLPESKSKESGATNSTVVSLSRYGLFSLGGEQIPSTFGEVGEAVKVAALRLVPKLQTLLAAKLWRLTTNEGSSLLGVKATLEMLGTLAPRTLMQRETLRTQNTEASSKKTFSPETGDIPTVTIGNRIQYRVENTSDRSVYLMLLGLNSSKTAIALFPWYKMIETEAAEGQPQLVNLVIPPGETRVFPQTTSGFEWVVQAPASLAETQLIFSTAPFTQTLAALETAKNPKAEQQRIQPAMNPLEVVQAVLQDLHNASAATEMNGTASDSYVLDVNQWASLSFIYQVV